MVDIAPSSPPLHLQPPPAAVAVAVPPNEVKQAEPHEKTLMRLWIQQARVPQWLRNAWDQWDKDRKYLHTDLFANGELNPNVMSVNLASRAIQAKTMKIAPTDADLSVTHQRGVGSVDDVRQDAIREAAAVFEANRLPINAAVLVQAADQAEQAYTQDLRARERFAQTAEALGKKLWDEARGTKTAQTFARQGMTVGPAWLKVGWQRDFGRDSLGRSRNDDAQDQLALLALRSAEFAAGEFTDSDPRYGEMMRLSDYARQVGRAVVDGHVEPGSMPFSAWRGIADSRDAEPVPSGWLPEPDAWQGAVIDTVRPEAMRWDWRVPFERWRDTPWVMEQNLMDVDDCAARFRLTPAERDLLGGRDTLTDTEVQRSTMTPSAAGENADPSRTTYEDTVQRGQVVVWERWDKRLRRHCIFVEGLDRFLVDEVPRLVAPDFFPYVEIGFNELDGAHLPVSHVMYLRKIQNAINQRLTDSEESLWASMKRYLVKKNAFKDGELDKLRSARPHDTIEVDSPEEIAATFKEIASDDWNPQKYSLDGLFRLFELVSGMSISELGVTGQADFATEAAIANQASASQSSRDANIMADALSRAFSIIIHYAASSMSERVVKGLVGMAAFWPQAPSRMDLIRSMSIKVSAAGSKAAARQQAGTQLRDSIGAINGILDLRMKALQQGATFNAQPLLTAAFRTIDADTPVRDVVTFPALAPAPAQQALPAPPAGEPTTQPMP
jgi:hypothetical protein